MKKVYPLVFLLSLIYFMPVKAQTSQEIFKDQELSFKKNHITSQYFPIKNVKNLLIKTTFETIEFYEIYGTEISVDIFSNNNTILPDITLKNNTLSIISSVIKKSEKATSGDICNIIIYIPKDIRLNNLDIFYAPEIFTSESYSPKNIIQNKKIIIPKIKAINTNIETINTDIIGENLTGSIIVKSTNGNISLNNINSLNFNKESNNNETQLYALTKTGSIILSTFTGKYLSLKAGSNITTKNISSDIFEIKTSEGTVTSTMRKAPNATSKIITNTGNIKIFIPKTESFSIKADSNRGFFYDNIQNQIKKHPYNVIKIYNNGKSFINLETISGYIELGEL